MTTETNTTAVTKNNYDVITGKTGVSNRTTNRLSYERKNDRARTYKNSQGGLSLHSRGTFFPATPFDAQSLAGTGALVFEGEMICGGN